ncbi:hypothetical protein F5Y13DRAFT_161176 [Hypoxylon sp. FL1857]|nr:hypothetical protein F5Y13DRAFT_161176 [Hypoxylon sp. FL1857]
MGAKPCTPNSLGLFLSLSSCFTALSRYCTPPCDLLRRAVALRTVGSDTVGRSRPRIRCWPPTVCWSGSRV